MTKPISTEVIPITTEYRCTFICEGKKTVHFTSPKDGWYWIEAECSYFQWLDQSEVTEVKLDDSGCCVIESAEWRTNGKPKKHIAPPLKG